MFANILSVLLWPPVFAARLLLIGVGFLIVPFTSRLHPIWGNAEHPVAPNSYQPKLAEKALVPFASAFVWWLLTFWWAPHQETIFITSWAVGFWNVLCDRRDNDYMWRAFRNPANNVRFIFRQPKNDDFWGGYANPDHTARKNRQTAWWFRRAGLASEFWIVVPVFRTVLWKYINVFEFRIGWKFGNVPGFGPTAQLRAGG